MTRKSNIRSTDASTRRSARPLGVMVVTVMALTGCEREVSTAPGAPVGSTPVTVVTSTGATSTGATSTGDPGTVVPGTTAPAVDQTTTASPETTFAEVTTAVVGTAVAGNSGGVGTGETNSFSEAVRNADGTCSGWAGPGGEVWTQGLEAGAPVTFVADDGSPIGSGQISSSIWEDVDPSDNEQWNCTFAFEGELTGQPDAFRIQVADLSPWRARVDPHDPTRYVVSVDSKARFDVFAECTEPATGLDEVFEFSAVGQFWANGIPSVCASGLVVVDLERPCRPPDFASEYIIAVTRADDASVVIEDASGFLADTAELPVGTEVVVHIVTGRPCG